MRRTKEDTKDTHWHTERGAAWLLGLPRYQDAICVGSRVTDKVSVLVKLLGFKSAIDMVLHNHGKRRSLTHVLQYQLHPAVVCGGIRLDSKFPYYLALISGAGGWLHPQAVDLKTLDHHHPAGSLTGGFPYDEFALNLADLRTGVGHIPKSTKKKSKSKGKDVGMGEEEEEEGEDAAGKEDPRKWCGALGGMLLLHVFTWPGAVMGLMLIRPVESPYGKHLECMMAALAQGDGQQATLPAHGPIAPRPIWAFGNGGHLHTALLSNALYSPGGVHPALVLATRVLHGVLCIRMAKSNGFQSLAHLAKAVPECGLRVVNLVNEPAEWPPGEHRVQLQQHHDSAVLVAMAATWLKYSLVTLASIEPGENFINVSMHVPLHRTYREQLRLGLAAPSVDVPKALPAPTGGEGSSTTTLSVVARPAALEPALEPRVTRKRSAAQKPHKKWLEADQLLASKLGGLELEEIPDWVRGKVIYHPHLLSTKEAAVSKTPQSERPAHPIHNSWTEIDGKGYSIGTPTRYGREILPDADLYKLVVHNRLASLRPHLRCEGASNLFSNPTEDTASPVWQDAHQDFCEDQMTSTAKCNLLEEGRYNGEEYECATFLVTLDAYGSILVYHPDEALRQVTPPVRIMMPNSGDAVELVGLVWHSGDHYQPVIGSQHIRAHFYMIDRRWPMPPHALAHEDRRRRIALFGAETLSSTAARLVPIRLLARLMGDLSISTKGLDADEVEFLEERERKISREQRKLPMRNFIKDDNDSDSD